MDIRNAHVGDLELLADSMVSLQDLHVAAYPHVYIPLATTTQGRF